MSEEEEEILDRILSGGFICSIFSFCSCIILFLIIICNKVLSSLTYNFLMLVFISEIIGNIGNICEYQNRDGTLLCKNASLLLIPFSDIFTMALFCFFSFCSIELIKKSNRKIKEKERLFFVISFVISFVYSIFIFYFCEEDNVRFYFYKNSKYNYIRFIHVVILFLMSSFITYETFIVVKFMKEKQKKDKVNSWEIAKLVKVLTRFPTICILYWFFYISL